MPEQNSISGARNTPLYKAAFVGDGLLTFLLRKTCYEIYPDISPTTWNHMVNNAATNKNLAVFSAKTGVGSGSSTFEAEIFAIWQRDQPAAQELVRRLLVESPTTKAHLANDARLKAAIAKMGEPPLKP